MAFSSSNMGLRVWDLPDDDFSRSELANNWTKLDVHDHTAGFGRQIPTGGIMDLAVTGPKIADLAVGTTKIANQAVTQAKLANGSVGTPQLIDLAVTTAKLADNAVTTLKLADNAVTTPKISDANVTSAKIATDAVTTSKILGLNVTEPKLANNAVSTRTILDDNVTEAKLATAAVSTAKLKDQNVTSIKLHPDVLPVGSVIPWWRPATGQTGLPGGWEICMGQTITNANHDFAEATSIVLPDLRNRFILGAATSGTGGATNQPPPIGGVGGAHTANLAHSHAIGGHTHGIASDEHYHLWNDEPPDKPKFPGNWRNLMQRGNAVYGNLEFAKREALYVPMLNFKEEYGENVDTYMSRHVHAHGGATGATALSTDSRLSAGTENRPAHVGLIYLIKVRY